MFFVSECLEIPTLFLRIVGVFEGERRRGNREIIAIH